jgi:hypothetical protein
MVTIRSPRFTVATWLGTAVVELDLEPQLGATTPTMQSTRAISTTFNTLIAVHLHFRVIRTGSQTKYF